MPSTDFRTKHRERRSQFLPKWIREVAPGRYQLRVPASHREGIYPVNFGIYPSVYEANRIAQKARYHLAGGASTWEALIALIAAGEVTPHITARYVYALSCGRPSYAIRVFCRGQIIDLPGPYRSPGKARTAARVSLRQSLRQSLVAQSTDAAIRRERQQCAPRPWRSTPATVLSL